MVDKELLKKAREWAKDKYPEYLEADEVIVALYKKAMGDKPKYNGYAEKEIVVIDEIEPLKYTGCLICWRKNCNEHGKRGTVIWKRYLVGTKDDEIIKAGVVPGKELVVGAKYKVKAKEKVWRGQKELTIYQFSLIHDGISDVIKQARDWIVSFGGRVKVASLHSFAMRKKVMPEAIIEGLSLKVEKDMETGEDYYVYDGQ